MVIVAGTFDLAPEDRDRYLESRRDAILAARAEEGCIEYAQGADSIDPGRVHLFEKWESEEALSAHLVRRRSEPEAPGRPPVLARSVLIYEVASVSPLDR